jgi:hypothetical protein
LTHREKPVASFALFTCNSYCYGWIGHGALAEKSLACMLPDEKEWPFCVRINAETMVGISLSLVHIRPFLYYTSSKLF